MPETGLVVATVAIAIAAVAVLIAVLVLRQVLLGLLKALDVFVRAAAASANPSGYLIAEEEMSKAHKEPAAHETVQVIE